MTKLRLAMAIYPPPKPPSAREGSFKTHFVHCGYLAHAQYDKNSRFA
ncbi:hypothetical protein [Campylobacter troglodytis]|nr:hypothetical protein [Campylobacter troglodytis]